MSGGHSQQIHMHARQAAWVPLLQPSTEQGLRQVAPGLQGHGAHWQVILCRRQSAPQPGASWRQARRHSPCLTHFRGTLQEGQAAQADPEIAALHAGGALTAG